MNIFFKDLPEPVLRDVMRKNRSGWKIFNWFSSSKTKKAVSEEKPKENDIKSKISPNQSPKKEAIQDKKPIIDNKQNKNIR